MPSKLDEKRDAGLLPPSQASVVVASSSSKSTSFQNIYYKTKNIEIQ